MLKPGLFKVGRIVSMCLRSCPNKHITALQVSIAKISCERLLLSKTCVTMWKRLPLNHSYYILTKSLVHGYSCVRSPALSQTSVFVTHKIIFFVGMLTDSETFTESKNKMVLLWQWEPWPSEFEVQKNDSLASIIEILYIKQIFFKRIVVC